MNILANFDDCLTAHFENTDKIAITAFIETLEMEDKRLFENKPSYLKSIRITPRSILTSKGYITFKRRYYFDERNGKYLYLLDSKFKINKYKKISDELVLKIMDQINENSYRKIGETLVNNHVVSKSTIYRVVKNAQIYLDESKITLQKFTGKVHLQIDEKYLRIRGFANKIPLYTCCMFTDKINVGTASKPRNKLVNKIIYGSFDMNDFVDQINFCLKNIYQVNEDTEIYLSGDLAAYIRNFNNKIKYCKATYIPDKWHVLKSTRDLMKHCNLEEYDSTALIEALKKSDKSKIVNQGQSYLVKLIKTHDDLYEIWDIEDYLGCCQECINSHHYSKRFYRTSSFSKETVEKINLIELGKCIGVKPTIGIKKTYFEDPDINYGHVFEDSNKEYNVNLDNFSRQTRKILANIIYGGNNN